MGIQGFVLNIEIEEQFFLNIKHQGIQKHNICIYIHTNICGFWVNFKNNKELQNSNFLIPITLQSDDVQFKIKKGYLVSTVLNICTVTPD